MGMVTEANSSHVVRKHLMKCEQCREHKKRCIPANRDWRSKKEKCERCSRLGHACGPPERASRTMQGKSTTIGFCVKTSPSAQVLRSSSSWQSPASSSCVPPFQCPMVPAKCTLAKLGDLHATRQLLRTDLLFCERVGRYLDDLVLINSIRAALTASVHTVELMFQVGVREVRASMENGDDLGCSREFILSELLRVLCQFFSSPTSSSSGPLPDQPGRLDLAVLQGTPQNSRQDKSLHSEAEFLCGGLKDMLGENASRARSTSRQPRSYVKASQAISRILSEIVLDNHEQRHLLYEWTYPPGHLAYMSGDDDAAFELWQNSYSGAGTDVLKRNLVHLAVYTSDAQMLQRMFRHDNKAAVKVTSDLFGLRPLQIAACRNDILCFSLMWQYDSDSALRDEMGQSVLGLAAKNGSCQVAALILGYSPRRRALLPALRAAINAKNEEISSIIVAHFNDETCLDTTQLRLTLCEARKAGFVKIASKLELIKQRSPATATAQPVVGPAVFDDWDYTSYYDMLQPTNMNKELLYQFPTPVDVNSMSTDHDCSYLHPDLTPTYMYRDDIYV